MTVIQKFLSMFKSKNKPAQEEFVYCRRCGKKLTTRESKMLGLGKQCYQKELKTKYTKSLF